MQLWAAVEQTVQETVKEMAKSDGLFYSKPSVYVNGVQIQWTTEVNEEDVNEAFYGRIVPGLWGAISQGLLEVTAEKTLYDCWKTGEDTKREFRSIFLISNRAVAIQRQGVVVVVAGSMRSIQELKELAEEYCRKVLSLTGRQS